MARVQRLSELKKERSVHQAFRQLVILVLTIIFGVLVSVSVNAQTTSKTTSKKWAKTKIKWPYKIKNRAKANHYAFTTENTKGEVESAPVISSVDIIVGNNLNRRFITEMVRINYDDVNTLAPLVFHANHQKLAAIDINPLLIAIEFAIQGKRIRLENAPNTIDTLDLTVAQLKEIKSFMCSMGAPEGNIVISDTAEPADRLTGTSRVEFVFIS